MTVAGRSADAPIETGKFFCVFLCVLWADLLKKIGASEGIRTLDIHLGKVTLYQTELRSLPRRLAKITGIRTECKYGFPVGGQS